MTPSGKFGYIDTHGNIVVKPDFSNASPRFASGLAPVMTADGRWGFINRLGEWSIKPAFGMATDFSDDGLAAVSLDGKWGYCDTSGNVVIAPQFDFACQFQNGVATVGKEALVSRIRTEFADEGATCVYWYIDMKGRRVSKATAERLITSKPRATSDPMQWQCVEHEGKWGYRAGHSDSWQIPPMYDYAYPFSCGFAEVFIAGKMRVIDTNGVEIWSADAK